MGQPEPPSHAAGLRNLRDGAHRPAEVQGAAAAQRDVGVSGVVWRQQPRRHAKQQAGDTPRRPRHIRVASLRSRSMDGQQHGQVPASAACVHRRFQPKLQLPRGSLQACLCSEGRRAAAACSMIMQHKATLKQRALHYEARSCCCTCAACATKAVYSIISSPS